MLFSTLSNHITTSISYFFIYFMVFMGIVLHKLPLSQFWNLSYITLTQVICANGDLGYLQGHMGYQWLRHDLEVKTCYARARADDAGASDENVPTGSILRPRNVLI